MTNLNGYLVPKMAMKEAHRPPVGRIGLQREKFLQENHSLLYDKMLLDGTLYNDLKQTEQRYWEQVEQTITKLLVSNPAPDKNNDPLGWTAHMNSLQAQAAELERVIALRCFCFRCAGTAGKRGAWRPCRGNCRRHRSARTCTAAGNHPPITAPCKLAAAHQG